MVTDWTGEFQNWLNSLDARADAVAFGGDKKKIGDAFYTSAASRADAAIDQWLQERSRES